MKENQTWGAPPTQPQPDEADVEALAGVLREYGLYHGSPVRRRELSVRLATEGMNEKQLRLVCEYQEERGRTDDQTAASIGHVLKTHSGWREFIDDLAFAKAKRAARGGKRDRHGRKDSGPTNQPARNYPTESLSRDQNYVTESYHTDGKTFEWLCEKLPDRSPELIELWIDEGKT